MSVLAEQDKISTWCVDTFGCFLIVNTRNAEVLKYLWFACLDANGNDTTTAKRQIRSGCPEL